MATFGRLTDVGHVLASSRSTVKLNANFGSSNFACGARRSEMETLRSIVTYAQSSLGLSSPFPLYLGAAATSVVFIWLLRRYFGGGVCYNKNRLDGKVVIITGANTGIGKETAVDLARRGAKVYMVCRSLERGRPALEHVKRVSGSSSVFLMKMDLGSKRSIKEFAENFLVREPQLHILINNAGRMHTPEGKTEDGFETQMGTNHLGHFYLTHLLLECLKQCSPSRIINVSSLAHTHERLNLDDLNLTKAGYNTFVAYGNSKLANILHAMELSRRLRGTGVTAYSLHPGAVATELAREYGIIFKVNTSTFNYACV